MKGLLFLFVKLGATFAVRPVVGAVVTEILSNVGPAFAEAVVVVDTFRAIRIGAFAGEPWIYFHRGYATS